MECYLVSADDSKPTAFPFSIPVFLNFKTRTTVCIKFKGKNVYRNDTHYNISLHALKQTGTLMVERHLLNNI